MAGGAPEAAFARRADGLAALAQGTAGFGAGLTEVKTTATDAAFEGAPAKLAAGRHLLTFADSSTDLAIVDLLQPPAG